MKVSNPSSMASGTQSTSTFGESQEPEDNRTPIRIPRLDLESPIKERAPFRRVNYQSRVSVTCPWRSSALKAVDP
ncbi:MAG: hypothetical protein LQ341_000970 [Variospora aurantia]|nr:MAG: hypothetical protein LQ341_000970 [Variospora aurantia]